MNQIFFMDIDGCLNDHTRHSQLGYCTIDKAAAERFNKLLWYTNGSFVLTSAWRYLVHSESMNLQGLKNLLLSHWMDGNRLIGITRKDEIGNGYQIKYGERATQIYEYLGSFEKIPNYIVIDDLDFSQFFNPQNFYRVNGKVGLTDNDILNILERLNDQKDI